MKFNIVHEEDLFLKQPKKLTRDQKLFLEKNCGLGHATIRKWDETTPRVDNLLKVSRETGIPMAELLEAVGTTSKNESGGNS